MACCINKAPLYGMPHQQGSPLWCCAVQGDGNKAVVAALKEAGVLLREEQYEHKYPYDWRTKKPTIFR
jgi:isoleucyl-tRNA synthetase